MYRHESPHIPIASRTTLSDKDIELLAALSSLDESRRNNNRVSVHEDILIVSDERFEAGEDELTAVLHRSTETVGTVADLLIEADAL